MKTLQPVGENKCRTFRERGDLIEAGKFDSQAAIYASSIYNSIVKFSKECFLFRLLRVCGYRSCYKSQRETVIHRLFRGIVVIKRPLTEVWWVIKRGSLDFNSGSLAKLGVRYE